MYGVQVSGCCHPHLMCLCNARYTQSDKEALRSGQVQARKCMVCRNCRAQEIESPLTLAKLQDFSVQSFRAAI
jgi:hypothetical protein